MALILLAAAVYLPALDAGFVWDDDDNVTQNTALRSRAGLTRIWTDTGHVPPWYPLSQTAFWAQYQAWAQEPRGYHAVNVLLHALNGVLAWRLLLCLGLPGAWLAAAVFAVHPVHVESVAWITEQKNLLSTALGLGAGLAWFRFRPPSADEADRPAWYLPACLLFVAALLAKTVLVTLPVVLLLLTWWKRGRLVRRDLLAASPLFVAALVLGGLTAWLEQHAVGAIGSDWALGAGQRVAIAGRALWFYAGKLLWPWPLIHVYPRWPIAPLPAWSLPAPLAAAAVPVILWRLRQSLGRGPFVAACCFGIMLSPALGFFDVYYMRYTFVADRWQYQASLALIALLAAGATSLSRRSGAPAAVLAGAVGLVLVVLGATTARQTRAYADEMTLWRDTLQKNPGALVAHNNLGSLLMSRGALDEAERHFREALAGDERSIEAHNNLGIVLFRTGRVAEALRAHRRALELAPDFADAHNNLGIALAAIHRLDEAMHHFRRAVELRPDLVTANFNLGLALLTAGDPEGAVLALETAARLDADDPETQLRLGLALVRSGRGARAVTALRRAVDLAPLSTEARSLLAWILATHEEATVRNGRDAVAVAWTLAAERPDDPRILDVLAAAYAEDGRFAEATQTAERALALSSDSDFAEQIAIRLAGYRLGRASRRTW